MLLDTNKSFYIISFDSRKPATGGKIPLEAQGLSQRYHRNMAKALIYIKAYVSYHDQYVVKYKLFKQKNKANFGDFDSVAILTVKDNRICRPCLQHR